ncbi:MAG: DNA-binding protein [Planctomycetota bacterium]
MTTQPLDQEIQSRIQSFLAELSDLVKKSALEAVQMTLAGGATTRRRGPGRPRGSGKRGPGRPRKTGRPAQRAKRSSEQVDAMAARVLAQVRSKQGQRLEQIAKVMKLPTKGLKLPIAKLMAAKKLKTKGRKRGTQYFTS